MKKLLFLLLAVTLCLCACERTERGVFYDGRELSEAEIEALMHRETEAETLADDVELLAFDETMTAPSEDCVFWTQGGSVYHRKATCTHLSNTKKIYYGTKEDASSCKKERPCLDCEHD